MIFSSNSKKFIKNEHLLHSSYFVLANQTWHKSLYLDDQDFFI